MGITAALNLPQAEVSHVEIMRAIAQDFKDLPMVLKGGTALLLCYGLDRFSEDLDFDAPKKFSVTNRIERVLSRFTRDFDIKIVKDTETVQRLKVHYRKETVDRLLKIETSFRQNPQPETVVVQDGIQTYRVSSLIDQKMAALVGRTKARDLYDVAYLARTYWEAFSPQAKQTLQSLLMDADALESRFRLAFEDDTILRLSLIHISEPTRPY